MPPTTLPILSEAEKADRVRGVVQQAGDDLRRRYPILKHQNAIGASILIVSLLGMIGTAWLYNADFIAWWLCIPVVALLASFTHELEHDLIHLMYFRKNPLAHNLMMWGVWLARPSTISPWARRRLHFNHHKHSGTEADLEERAITNGETWGLRRLLMTGDLMLAVYLRPITIHKTMRHFLKVQKVSTYAERRAILREQLLSYWPLTIVHYTLWHGFIVYHGLQLAGVSVPWPSFVAPAMHGVDFLAVVLLAPNALRTFCLHFISSNMHYYGDVNPDSVVEQCQVLNSPWVLPFNLFCFNFGSTHAIHHFVVKEPFYLRQMTAGRAHRVMREVGVRFNDFGSFTRANRFHPLPSRAPSGSVTPA